MAPRAQREPSRVGCHPVAPRTRREPTESESERTPCICELSKCFPEVLGGAQTLLKFLSLQRQHSLKILDQQPHYGGCLLEVLGESCQLPPCGHTLTTSQQRGRCRRLPPCGPTRRARAEQSRLPPCGPTRPARAELKVRVNERHVPVSRSKCFPDLGGAQTCLKSYQSRLPPCGPTHPARAELKVNDRHAPASCQSPSQKSLEERRTASSLCRYSGNAR